MSTMQLPVLAMLALAAASLFAVAVERAESSAQPTKPAEKKTGYVPVNGLKMYYELTGEGKPAVYIHPFVSHCGLVSGLTKNRRWIAMDLQGHGRTADIDRPMTCEQHADDIAALLKHLKVEHADFFGDSFGGTIAVMMAVRHPRLVRRVVSYGSPLAPVPKDVAAVVTELVTNAIRHVCGDGTETVGITLSHTRHPEAVTVVVSDSSPEGPAMREVPTGSERGRGLRIVQALSAHWGWRPEEGGKAIFAILAKEAGA